MSPGGGELSLSVCPGVGNRTSSTQMPGGVPGGGMVTGRIEPRIFLSYHFLPRANLGFCTNYASIFSIILVK